MTNKQHYRVFPYLRASTSEQDELRAWKDIQEFAKTKSIELSTAFTENISGTKLDRPELNRLLDFAQANDIILIESMDRLTRLSLDGWEELSNKISTKGIGIVSISLPSTHSQLQVIGSLTDKERWHHNSINRLLLDFAAESARANYEELRKRTTQGAENRADRLRAKGINPYPGKQEDETLLNGVADLLNRKNSYSDIIKLIGCSRSTVAKVSKRIKNNEPVYQPTK